MTDLFRLGVEAAAKQECPYCRDNWPRFISLLFQDASAVLGAPWHRDPRPDHYHHTPLCSAPWRDTLQPNGEE